MSSEDPKVIPENVLLGIHQLIKNNSDIMTPIKGIDVDSFDLFIPREIETK